MTPAARAGHGAGVWLALAASAARDDQPDDAGDQRGRRDQTAQRGDVPRLQSTHAAHATGAGAGITAPTFGTVLVVTGEAGMAARTDLSAAPAQFQGSIVDDWTIRPTDGRPVEVVVVKPPAAGYMLTIAEVADPAVEFLLCEPLPVATDQQAREAARHLARAVVHGTLPAAPTSTVDRAQWQMCIPVVARIVARAWPATRNPT